MPEIQIGQVNDYFAHVGVAGIELTDVLKVGDTIRIHGHTTDLQLMVPSMQIEHDNVAAAKAGDSVGVKVPERVRKGDHVYKVLP